MAFEPGSVGLPEAAIETILNDYAVAFRVKKQKIKWFALLRKFNFLLFETSLRALGV